MVPGASIGRVEMDFAGIFSRRQLFDSVLRAFAQIRQAAKTAFGILGVVAVGHALDRSVLDRYANLGHGDKLPFDIMDICLLVGMFGIYIAGAVRVAGDNSLVPLADPRLKESLNFENT